MPSGPDSCVLDLDSRPQSPQLTKVVIDDFEVPKVEDCATESGWVYREVTCPMDTIELCGQSCLDLHVAGEALVEYFCLGG
jgi:hypothetical protein